MADEGSIVQTVFYVLLLIVLGALYITAATYTFQFTNAVEPNVGDDATLRRNYHWTRFGGVMIGLIGALTLLPIVFLIVAAVGAGAAAAVDTARSKKRANRTGAALTSPETRDQCAIDEYKGISGCVPCPPGYAPTTDKTWCFPKPKRVPKWPHMERE